jgi:hypothetical protein
LDATERALLKYIRVMERTNVGWAVPVEVVLTKTARQHCEGLNLKVMEEVLVRGPIHLEGTFTYIA